MCVCACFQANYIAHHDAEPRVRAEHISIFENLPKMRSDDTCDDYNDDDDHEALDNCLPEKQFDRSQLKFEVEVGQGNFGFVLKASHVDLSVRQFV